jgi:hypothetical protein
MLFVFLLLLSLALLCRLSWPHLKLSHAPAGSKRALGHRLLKPRTPLDCPLCRLASPGVEPISAPLRPWSEVKSRRGAGHSHQHRGLCLSQPALRAFWHH